MTSSNPSKKVLLLALSGIGNFLMQSPVFAAIKKAHPDWHVTAWVAPRGTKELAANDPHLDAVIEAPLKQSLSGHLNLLRQLRRHQFEAALMLSPGQLIKGALYMFLAGIPMRLAHNYPLRSNPAASFLLTRSFPEDPALHDLEQNLALLKLLNIPIDSLLVTCLPNRQAHYSLLIPPTAYRAVKELWSQLNIPPDKTIIGLHPGSARGFEWKRWPLAYWIELGQTLITKHNAFILIFGGPDEQETINKLLAGLPRAAQRTKRGPASLLATAALMQRCKLFVSNDSGLMHLAAASGVTTLGLFGPTDENQTGPRGTRSHTLRAPGTQPVYNTESNPTLGHTPHPSLCALKPQQVLDKIFELLA